LYINVHHNNHPSDNLYIATAMPFYILYGMLSEVLVWPVGISPAIEDLVDTISKIVPGKV